MVDIAGMVVSGHSKRSVDYAREYMAAGLKVMPIRPDGSKAPALSEWQPLQKADRFCPISTFKDGTGLAAICGEASGNLECIDFDTTSDKQIWNAWKKLVDEHCPGLIKRLIHHRTPRGGRHLIYRCESVAGNQKLAFNSDKKVLIETRGNGGYFLLPGSPPECHELQGEYIRIGSNDIRRDLVEITPDERSVLLSTCRLFNELPHEHRTQVRQQTAELRPGDDLKSRPEAMGEMIDLLQRQGWVNVRRDAWRRPGKEKGWSAMLRRSAQGVPVLVNFSSNTPGLNSVAPDGSPGCSYDLFQLKAIYEHGGDFNAAATDLAAKGYGESIEATMRGEADPDISSILFLGSKENKGPPEFPEECLVTSGALSAMIDWNQKTSIKPQPILALAGAIALWGALLGRKVKDDYDTRTNIMVIGLAPSGAGKEHARACNKRVLIDSDCWDIHASERVGSHAGMVTALNQHPSRLFQIDEIGRMFRVINGSRDPNSGKVIDLLMSLYTASNQRWISDAYADASKVKTINEPCLCIYGTSTDNFYEAIRAENLSDGLIGRMLIFEAGYGTRKRPRTLAVPDVVLEQIEWIKQLQTEGNLGDANPAAMLVNKTPEAAQRHEKYCDDVYDRHESDSGVEAALWTRAPEKAAKLALIHACATCDPGDFLEIGLEDVCWAIRLVNYSTRLVLHASRTKVSQSKFDSNLKRVFSSFRYETTQRDIQRRNRHLASRELDEILQKLIKMELVTIEERANGGRPSRVIRKTGDDLPE